VHRYQRLVIAGWRHHAVTLLSLRLALPGGVLTAALLPAGSLGRIEMAGRQVRLRAICGMDSELCLNRYSEVECAVTGLPTVGAAGISQSVRRRAGWRR
jgi:hypothetical protein